MLALLAGYTTMYAGKYMNQYGGKEAGGLGQVGKLEARER